MKTTVYQSLLSTLYSRIPSEPLSDSDIATVWRCPSYSVWVASEVCHPPSTEFPPTTGYWLRNHSMSLETNRK